MCWSDRTVAVEAPPATQTHPCELFLCLSPSIIHCRIFWFLSRSSSCTWASMPRPLSSPLPDVSGAFLPPRRGSVLPLLLQDGADEVHAHTHTHVRGHLNERRLCWKHLPTCSPRPPVCHLQPLRHSCALSRGLRSTASWAEPGTPPRPAPLFLCGSIFACGGACLTHRRGALGTLPTSS